MSLIHFHRLLIATAILFCAGFGVWELAAFADDRSPLRLLLAVASGLAAAALGYYLRNLSRFLGAREGRRD